MSLFSWIEGLIDPYQPYEPTTPPKQAWPFLKPFLRPLRKLMVLSLSLAVISAMVEVWLINYLARLIDKISQTTPDRIWADMGTELMLVGLFILLIRPIAPLLRESLYDLGFWPNASTLIQWRAHRHVLSQSVGWFHNEQAGKITGQVMRIGVAAAGSIYQVLHAFSYVFVYVIGAIFVMASFDVRLVLPLVLWGVLYVGLLKFALPRYEKTSARMQETVSEKSGLLVDSYSNIDTVKLFSNRALGDQESYAKFEDARQAFFSARKVEIYVNVGMLILNGILMVALVGYSIVLWSQNAAPVGIVAASFALSFRINDMASWLLDAMTAFFAQLGTLREILKTVAQPLGVEDTPDAVDMIVTDGEIRLDNVRHHYGKGYDGLDGINLLIAAGEKVGIVGRSGAGKSSLVNLVLRFFDLEGGDILIDGQSIRTVTQDSLRAAIGMVTQDAALLHRPVKDNIGFGADGVTQDQIEAAAKQAEAHDFILRLEDQMGRKGYDAHVGDRGVKLSGGQRQRIAIARVILKNAPILILDEATSALDSEVEAVIQNTFYDVMQGKTVIAIAHRLSTIAKMDRIIVLDEGKIVEQGTHVDLIEKNGLYAGLWNRQSGGFLGEDT